MSGIKVIDSIEQFTMVRGGLNIYAYIGRLKRIGRSIFVGSKLSGKLMIKKKKTVNFPMPLKDGRLLALRTASQSFGTMVSNSRLSNCGTTLLGQSAVENKADQEPEFDDDLGRVMKWMFVCCWNHRS